MKKILLIIAAILFLPSILFALFSLLREDQNFVIQFIFMAIIGVILYFLARRSDKQIKKKKYDYLSVKFQSKNYIRLGYIFLFWIAITVVYAVLQQVLSAESFENFWRLTIPFVVPLALASPIFVIANKDKKDPSTHYYNFTNSKDFLWVIEKNITYIIMVILLLMIIQTIYCSTTKSCTDIFNIIRTVL